MMLHVSGVVMMMVRVMRVRERGGRRRTEIRRKLLAFDGERHVETAPHVLHHLHAVVGLVGVELCVVVGVREVVLVVVVVGVGPGGVLVGGWGHHGLTHHPTHPCGVHHMLQPFKLVPATQSQR